MRSVVTAVGMLVMSVRVDWFRRWRYEYRRGTNDHGREVGSGVYFYRLSVSGETEVRKMVVVK